MDAIYNESELYEQAALLSAIKNTDICTFWYYPQQKLITVNDRTAQMYSCNKIYKNMPKSFADDFVHPSTQEAFFEMYRRIDAGEKTAHASFSSIDCQNWVTVTLTTITYSKDGKPEKTFGVIQNISQLKLQEAEFHSRKQTLSDIIGALSKIYMFNYYIDLPRNEFTEIIGLEYITNTLGTNGNAMLAFQQITNTLIADNSKKEFGAFVNLSTLAERIGSQQNISLEYSSVKKGWCRASFIVVNRDETGNATQVEFVVENISEARKRELEAREELEKAYEAANKANASKSAFLNNMSHDIRTPMNAIVGFSTIAESHIDDKERVKDCIEKITTSSKHLLSIINEVLDMSRIESGKIQIQEQETNLPSVMRDLINIIQGQIHAKGLDLQINTLDLTHENVYADEARMHRVLLNLVGNAIKFTPSGGKISIQLVENSQTIPGHGNYTITVKDTGIGMSKEFLPHIFEAFEREQTSTISKMEGTGLGMAITKKIITLMGGTITAESEQGKGSVFTIHLSLRLIDSPLQDPKIEKLTGLRALVVDDDYDVCNSVAKMLDRIGMEPEWTMSGKEAILHTKSSLEMGRHFSVYIVDWKIPDMNGIEVVQRLRKLAGSEVPIIMMSSYDFGDIEKEAKENGATALCQKPLFLSQLRNTLLEYLGEESSVYKKESSHPMKKKYYDKHILLVEDNELNREIAMEILQENGFCVDTAENGKIALDKISGATSGKYDIVLMDVQMPIMDGYDATRAIRRLSPDWIHRLPILAMTANAFEEDRKAALAAGMNGHLTKPINVEMLLETLSEILQD